MNIKYVVVHYYDFYTSDYSEVAYFDNVEDAIKCMKDLVIKNKEHTESYEIIVDFD